MGKNLKLRDPIHGFIELEGRECDLINLDIFQRLRRIRQLAFANLVYHGALHTRFDHSLGVFYLAKKMAGVLNLSVDETAIIKFAALLHDIGHGPFSHVSETLLDRYAPRDKLFLESKKDKIHEIITGRLIKEHHSIKSILGETQCDQVAKVLSSGYSSPVLKSIVSGPLDADKQDYLLRDSHFCGVRYGLFDFHQLQRSIKKAGSELSQELMILPESVHAIEQFIMAKYYMTTMVYRHKVRLITDQMIIRAIILGIEKDNLKEMKRLFYYNDSDKYIKNYLLWDDNKFLLGFGEEGNPKHKSKALIDGLINRLLLKRIISVPITCFTPNQREVLADINNHENICKDLEKQIAKVIGNYFKTRVDADFVILHSYEIKSVKEMAKNDESELLVYSQNQLHKRLEDESVLLKSIKQKLSEHFVEVYAPAIWEDHAFREQAISKLKPLILDVIRSTIGSDTGGKA